MVLPIGANANTIGGSETKPSLSEKEIQLLEDYTCTVELYAKLSADGDWKFVSAGIEGSVKFSSTKNTCVEAVDDIQAGMVHMLLFR